MLLQRLNKQSNTQQHSLTAAGSAYYEHKSIPGLSVLQPISELSNASILR